MKQLLNYSKFLLAIALFFITADLSAQGKKSRIAAPKAQTEVQATANVAGGDSVNDAKKHKVPKAKAKPNKKGGKKNWNKKGNHKDRKNWKKGGKNKHWKNKDRRFDKQKMKGKNKKHLNHPREKRANRGVQNGDSSNIAPQAMPDNKPKNKNRKQKLEAPTE